MLAEVGEVIAIVGAVVSVVVTKEIESRYTAETLPAASLYHTYTVLVPAPLVKI